MLLIILSWIYICFIFFSLGLVCISFIEKVVSWQVKTATDNTEVWPAVFLLIGGMILTAVIASVYSLFQPLSYAANIVLLILSLLCLFLKKGKAVSYFKYYKSQVTITWLPLTALYIAFVFILAYLSAQQSSHYDDGLYYSTSIKWIEEYGTVKGLANINPRIGFNSTWHLLHAIFSFHYLHSGNFNDLNGLLILIALVYSLGGLNKLLNHHYHVITVIRAFFLFPLLAFHFGASHDFIFYNINSLSSSSADIAVCLLLWIGIIWVFELDFIRSEISFYRQSL